MEAGNKPSDSDWEQPLTDQELEAIETAFQSAAPTPSSSSSSNFSSSSPIKRRHVGSSNSQLHPKTRRKLPDSVFSSTSFSLSLCSNNRFSSYSRSSYQAKSMARYPAMIFGGRIVYSRTFAEVEKAADEILKFVEARKKEDEKVILGFDIEWRPTFRRGVLPGKAAVMQICGDTNCCYVMQIIHSGLPQNLKSLLEDPTSLKVGVCIANDATKVFNDHNVSMKALEDLSSLANQKLGGKPKKWSLGLLTEMLVCKELPKPNKIRLGNWEANVLSKEQLQYAATDAFASWYLYKVMKGLPDATDDNSNKHVSV